MAMSKDEDGVVRHRTYGRWAKVVMPVKAHCANETEKGK